MAQRYSNVSGHIHLFSLKFPSFTFKSLRKGGGGALFDFIQTVEIQGRYSSQGGQVGCEFLSAAPVFHDGRGQITFFFLCFFLLNHKPDGVCGSGVLQQ